MRLARVACGSCPHPVLALERDGALYDAAELERIFGTRFSPGTSDFHRRAVALGGAGLDELDERLRAGDRPTGARLFPGSFVWLPPCDTDRALYVQMAAYDETGHGGAASGPTPRAPAEPYLAEPLYRLGDARGLLGHGCVVPYPSGMSGAVFELGLAAVLRDDLSGADPAEAERAILGYTILNGWSGRDQGVPPGWGAGRVPAQIGPILVTPSELGDVGRLKAQARVEGKVASVTTAGGWAFSPAASIAWVSRWISLRAGDVIGLGGFHGGRGDVPFGATVELLIERLGKLAGRPVARPA